MNTSLSARRVVKTYGGVVALADGNLQVQGGQVMALLGANGSGKSTLSKIITGVVTANSGELLLNERPLRLSSPQAARKQGISAVYQELSLVPDLTVAENIWLTHEPLRLGMVNRRAMRQKTRDLLDLFGGTFKGNLQPEAPINTLSPDEKQIVEILKALSYRPRLMILDESTASLDSQQVSRLFDLVTDWKKSGMAIIFVSHRMEEIFRIADAATVLRNGYTVGERAIHATDERELVELMIEGREKIARHKSSVAAPDGSPALLRVENLRTSTLKGVSFSLEAGELLGLGGLQGQGQADLLLAIFGAQSFSGTIQWAGQAVHFRHPRQAMQADIAFVPGERAAQGLLLIRSILDNFQLASWGKYGTPLNMKRSRADAGRMSEELKLVMAGLDAPVSSLSGGNAQKVVIGKWLLRQPKLLLLNDPTKGIDVGAKSEFYALLDKLRAEGTAILFYTSDDDELLGLCDRVLVLHDGRICAELQGEALTHSALVSASLGATQ
jgi:ribose transport system ATP-binding protein